ncbi:hypothetical protein BH11PLA2_BH11PLA2_46170 [soil metagenome]
MAKPLVVTYRGESIALELEKVDRTKLYGFVETVVLDDAGKHCELGTLSSDGHSVVGKGGTALAYLSHDGQWRTKAELKPVDPDGKAIEPVKSTFDAPVTLDRTANIVEFLSHNITTLYQLTPDGMAEELQKDLQGGTIYQFPFSYRGGLEASAGFLLQGADGHLFLCVGVPTAFEFVGLQATAAVVSEDATADEDDSLDFNLV